MDPLTHGLLGATAGVGALSLFSGRGLPLARPAATGTPTKASVGLVAGIGFAAALVPDLDILVRSASDPLLTHEVHRRFTHSLLLAPALGLVASLLLYPFSRRRLSGPARWSLTTLSIASAGLLDACTSYGTSLLWPLSEERFAWRLVSAVDPILTLLLLVPLILAVVRRAPGIALWGLLGSVLYLGLGWIQNERAEFVARTVAGDRGQTVERLEVKPALGSLLIWRSIYRAEGRFHVDAFRLGLLAPIRVYPGGSLPALDPLSLPFSRGSVQGRDIVRFARLANAFTVLHPDDEFVLGDIRYALLPYGLRPLWGIRFDPGHPDEHVEYVTFREASLDTLSAYLDLLLDSDRGPGER